MSKASSEIQRKKFESWWRTRGESRFARLVDGKYASKTMHERWIIWQAAVNAQEQKA